jgi:F-type H+-transporting ATPase subunit epsilon
MANTYLLQVITPERIMLSEQVQQTIAPGAEGYLGVLAHHAPLMTTLLPGEVRATLADGRTTSHIVVSGGVLEVSAEGAVILADSAQRSDEVDVTRAEVDLSEARRMMAELPPGSAESRAAITNAQFAEARIRAGRTEG